METWNHGHLDDMITRVFDRLRNVLVLIAEAKGKNDLVETKRGKNFYLLDLPIDLSTESDSDAPALDDEFGNEEMEDHPLTVGPPLHSAGSGD